MNESKCPVPSEQQPINEFIDLSKSKKVPVPQKKQDKVKLEKITYFAYALNKWKL